MGRNDMMLLIGLATIVACRAKLDKPTQASEAEVPMRAASSSSEPLQTDADAGLDASQPRYPVPVRPTPPESVQPGVPVNLKPTPDCVHPTVEADCQDGFCRIPPGCFIMGSPRDRAWAGMYADVQVQVTLTHAFEMSEAEVTNAEWLDAGLDLPLRNVDLGRCDDAECPISNVNFYEVLTFLNLYSELHGLSPCYELPNCTGTFGSGPICSRISAESGDLDCDRKEEDGLVCDGPFLTAETPYLCEGYRLPTEAEWEYAAKGGTSWATWLGNIDWQDWGTNCVGPNPNLDPIAWYCWNSDGDVQPGKQKWPNPWGLYDILGNVSEWTNTTISYGGYGQSPQVDPVGYWYDRFGYTDRNLFPIALDEQELARQDHPTMRGGNRAFEALVTTSEQRAIFAGAYQGSSGIGFRMVRTLSDVGAARSWSTQ